MNKVKDLSVIILSAGLSTRYPKQKAFEFYNSKFTFVEKIIDTYINFGISEIILVLNNSSYNEILKHKIVLRKEIHILINHKPELGKFSSLKLASSIVNKNNYCYIQCVDNPFVDSEILEMLNKNSTNDDYIVPRHNNKGGHPVLISPNILKNIELQDNNKNMNIFFNTYKKHYIDTNNKSVLYNINTFEDYKLIFTQEQK